MSMLLEAGMGGSRRRRRGFAPVAFSPTQLFASGEQGVWYDPSDLTAEKVSWRRNLLTWSEALNDAVWTKNGTQITADDTTAPDGTLTADRVNPNVTNAIAIVHSGSVTIDNLNRTGSVYLKYGNWQYMTVCLQRFNDTSGWVAITVDLVNGTITKTGNGATATYVSSAITAAANGFYRVELTGIGATSTGCALEVSFAPSGNPTYGVYGRTNVTGTASDYTHVWGAQLEIASAATAYQRITNFSNDFLAAFPNTALFQNSTGTTPVTALGQPVGLVLDKSQGALNNLGAETVTNGDFNGGTTGWSSFAGSGTSSIAVVSGELRVTTSLSTGVSGARQVLTGLTAGQTYFVTANAFVINSNNVPDVLASIRWANGNVTSGFSFIAQAVSATPTHISGYFVPTSSTATLALISGGNGTSSATYIMGYDDVSVKAVPGNHVRQTTDASRPTLQARSNLLIRTEEFENAAWTKARITVSANAAVAPNGTTTAEKLVASSGSGFSYVRQTPSLPAATYTLSCYAKAAEWNFIELHLDDSGGQKIALAANLTTGQLTITAGTGTATNVGDGWWRITGTGTCTTAPTISQINIANNNTQGSQTGNAVDGVFIWGAQLELGSSATTYQRVTTATDYADIGLPRALTFDGTDDSLVTAATVDFSGTNQMTVCGGIFKQSDTAYGAILDLTADPDNTNGGFAYGVGSATGDASRRTYALVFRRTVASIKTAYIYAAPDLKVFTGQYDGAQSTANTQLTIRLNGATPTTAVGASNATSGVFANAQLFVGRRNQTSSPFNGRIHQLIVRGALTSGAQLTSTEQWVAQKTGVTLP